MLCLPLPLQTGLPSVCLRRVCLMLPCYRFLSEYAESGHFSCLDIVDHLNPAMLINDQMIFLGTYVPAAIDCSNI